MVHVVESMGFFKARKEVILYLTKSVVIVMSAVCRSHAGVLSCFCPPRHSAPVGLRSCSCHPDGPAAHSWQLCWKRHQKIHPRTGRNQDEIQVCCTCV